MKSSTPMLVFESRGRRYACDLLWIREVLRQPPVHIVDSAPAVVRGLVHLRGQILTALDLEARIGRSSQGDAPSARCIVFKTATELSRLPVPPTDVHLAEEDLLGILVDGIGDIMPVGTDILPPPPESLSGLDPACTSGVIPLRDDLVTVLNIGPVLATKQNALSAL